MKSMTRGESLKVQLRPRDLELLSGLFESRVMTLAHLSTLYFDVHHEAAKKRVQKLKRAGYLRERPRRVNEPSILTLASRGIDMLSANGHLAGYPQFDRPFLEKRMQVSPLTLRHELEVIDVKAAMVSAIRATSNFSVSEFSTWPAIHEFRAQRHDGQIVLVKPDGFIRVEERETDHAISEHTFFLELDRSTESLDILAGKADCYRDFYRRGGLALKHGQPATEFDQFPFRVLFVLKSSDRQQNIAQRLLALSPPILTQVWMTTLGELLDDPLGRVWLRPVDFRLDPSVASAKKSALLAP